ncbi:MAG: tRNA (cytidine(34)-2'-O)-methyltransferase [Firmicutes bacterium]|nr:tRNA (cytidine(34)-2'-O)-methyltransferase [Bacillota bacterium]MBQ9604250.1 tRNA (cytidine(34)-2'-O)-methyltransferase [Bacillota bacterium]
MNIVLHQPEIPQNTGNIGRTCVATNTALHLIRPLGFNVDDKSLKRAGMDYWKDLKVFYYDNFADFVAKNPDARIIMATTKARKTYDKIEYRDNDFIMFGSEGSGIPEEILLEYKENCVRIPMMGEYRSLNLSNSVAVILYEALRQQGFDKFTLYGSLHHHDWSE